jgi:tripartite-type tricarboxylate transporter receptor subunit TctC
MEDVPGLATDAKANPGKINYGTPGAGTSLHITMEQIAKRQGIKWTHVPFKGNAEAMNALLGGHIHAVADSSGWAPLVSAGRFRLLVTWGAARANWPDVPTLQIGIDMVSNSPFGIAGEGMDPTVVRFCTTPSRRDWKSLPMRRRWRLDQERST